MSEIRILSAAQVDKLFTVEMAMQAVEDAYTQKCSSAGGGRVPSSALKESACRV